MTHPDTAAPDYEPCCYGFTTSRGQVHEIDCSEFERC